MGGGVVGGRVKVAVRPLGTRDWVCEAVTAGGGVVAEPGEADALMWTDSARAPQLRELLQANPHIRWVQLPWAGVEPFVQVLDHDRVWTSGKGVYAQPVAEHALTLALAGLRQLKRYATTQRWSEQGGISLMGGRVTVFGGGGITRELVPLLRALNCDITVVRRHPEPMGGVTRVLGFDQRYEALKGADVVVLALALTAETKRLMTSVEFEVMEPHAWLVNVARGAHVATEDLAVALMDGTIGGAALDVTEPEPLPAGHPLWSLPNCLITPHTANTEDMAKPLLSARITENVRRYAAGEPLVGVVDPGLGY